MINSDLNETQDHQEIARLVQKFRKDVEFAGKELEKIEKKERRWQLILAFYTGVAFTLITVAIAILVNKGIRP